MSAVRFSDVQARPTEFLGLTSLTPDEFELLISPFEDAFQTHIARWRLDGKPRTARQFAVYKNCPLPTPQDRLFFLLTYLKTYSLQVIQGRLFGMGQSKANQWIHVLLPCLQTALRTLGETPARSLSALAQRLGVTVAEASATVATPGIWCINRLAPKLCRSYWKASEAHANRLQSAHANAKWV